MLRAAIVGVVVASFAASAHADCPPGKPCNDPKSLPSKSAPPAPTRPAPAAPGPAAPAPAAPATAPVPVAPKQAGSCAASRKREADLVNRLAVANRRISDLEAAIALRDRRDAEEIRRLQEEQRKLSTPLK